MEQVITASAESIDEGRSRRAADEAAPLPTAGENSHRYAGSDWTAEHPLNVRISIPLVFGRYYITIVAGKERRARARLALDRREHPLDRPGNVVFLFMIGLIAAAGSVSLGYMLLAYLLGWSGRLVL